ncbi:hypothetical protein FKW77_009548 [Venturia effusa]|uniref:Uncharacterized protein n=1 Tax=Venturia effusa TaxID=50376 RepID=A0A517L839_9PEZI|nr:hypothetical protein FKW77_009548 [Venturia effusa]
MKHFILTFASLAVVSIAKPLLVPAAEDCQFSCSATENFEIQQLQEAGGEVAWSAGCQISNQYCQIICPDRQTPECTLLQAGMDKKDFKFACAGKGSGSTIQPPPESPGKNNTKPETKPETKPDHPPDTSSETPPDTSSETPPDNSSETPPDNSPDNPPDTNPVTKPKPTPKPTTKPISKPTTKPAPKPAPKSEPKPQPKPQPKPSDPTKPPSSKPPTKGCATCSPTTPSPKPKDPPSQCVKDGSRYPRIPPPGLD